MKKYSCHQLSAVLAITALFLTSCGSIKTGDFTARKYTHYDNKQQAAVEFQKTQEQIVYAGTDIKYLSNKDIVLQQPQSNFFEKSEFKKQDYRAAKKEIKALLKTNRHQSQFVNKGNKITNTPSSDRNKSIVLSKAPSDDSEFWLEVILSIIIPPLGVFLHVKETNEKFWISVLLTLLFWLPGAIYAILVITESI